MALGDRLKKVASSMTSNGNTHQRRAAANSSDDADAHDDMYSHHAPHNQQRQPMRTHKSNHSLLSSGSSGSTILVDADHMTHPSSSTSHNHHARPQSKAGSSTYISSSAASEASSGSGGSSVSAVPKVIMKGYLLLKKGMLKGYEKRFYIAVARTPDLFSFKDEAAYEQWRRAELPLRSLHISGGFVHDSSVGFPQHVCNVLRADRAGESSAFDRAIAVISGDETKCTSYKFVAPTMHDCEAWIEALHHIQLTRRHRSDSTNNTGSGGLAQQPQPRRGGYEPTSASTTPIHSNTNNSSSRQLNDDAFDSLLQQHAHRVQPAVTTPQHAPTTPAAAAGFKPHDLGASHISDDASDSVSQHSSHSAHNHHNNTTSSGSVVGMATGSSASAPGAMLLFVPAAGSAISISDSKLAQAKKEMEELVAKGAKPPVRGGMDNLKGTKWRYGPPQYILNDLEYVKGKTRDHDSTPLESYVETCCQTFVMEATHKAVYQEWSSVRHEYFYVQVNDGEQISGRLLRENDLFGMLYLTDMQVDMDLRDNEERKDPRAVLAEAFTQGFPMEVLDVYTQPPQCHFAWRHWGRFTGRYKGVRGNGELVELRGFGQMHIDSGRLLNLRLFFKQRDLFDQLNKIAAKAGPLPTRSRQAPAKRETAPSTPAPAATQPQQPQPPQPQPQAQAQPQPQRPLRSDKLSDSMIGDFTSTVNLSRSNSGNAQRDREPSTPSNGNVPQQPPSNTRAQMYQRFMPQAPGA